MAGRKLISDNKLKFVIGLAPAPDCRARIKDPQSGAVALVRGYYKIYIHP